MFNWEEEVSIEKVPMGQSKSVGAISLLMTLCERARPTVVLGGVGKQAEQAIRKKPVSSVFSWSLLQFLLLPSSCLAFLI